MSSQFILFIVPVRCRKLSVGLVGVVVGVVTPGLVFGGLTTTVLSFILYLSFLLQLIVIAAIAIAMNVIVCLITCSFVFAL